MSFTSCFWSTSCLSKKEEELRHVFRTYMVLRLHLIYPKFFSTFYSFVFKRHIGLEGFSPHKEFQNYAKKHFPPFEVYKASRKRRLSFTHFVSVMEDKTPSKEPDIDARYLIEIFEETCLRIGPTFFEIKSCEENCIKFCLSNDFLINFLIKTTWEEMCDPLNEDH